MADYALHGYQCYLIIEEQYGDQCPLADPLYDSGGALVRGNAVFYVDEDNTDAVYQSFTNFIGTYNDFKGWIFDTETGEGRYYDGTQQGTVTDYWYPWQRSCGLVLEYNPTISRSVTEMFSIGSQKPEALRTERMSNNMTLNKVWIDTSILGTTNKSVTPSNTNLIPNQFAMRGDGLVNVDEFVLTLKQNYYLVILYCVDLDTQIADSNVAWAWVAPCTKFGEINLTVNADGIVMGRMTANAMYIKDIPPDGENIAVYETANGP